MKGPFTAVMLSCACGTTVRLATMSPPSVLTVMGAWVLAVVPAAAGGMTRVALIEVVVAMGGTPLNSVMPAGRVRVDPRKPVPLMVTSIVELAEASGGWMLTTVGFGAVMVNASGLRVLAPLGVVTTTLTSPSAAVSGMTKVAAIWVALLVIMVAVILGPAVTPTPGKPGRLAPSRSVPVMFTIMLLGPDPPGAGPLGALGISMLRFAGGTSVSTVK